MYDELILKVALLIVGALASFVGGLIVWGLKNLISTVFENTIALKVVSEKLNEVNKTIDKIPELERDLSKLGASHRSLREKVNALEE